MEAKLIVVGGKANKGEIDLKLPTLIGRSRDAQLTVAHPMVSRQHCEIYEVDGLLMIRDLGSLNGTIVEGQRVSEAPLCPANEFTVGPLTFRAEYEYDGDLDAVPAPKVVEDSAVTAPTSDNVEEIPDFEAMAAVAAAGSDETEQVEVEGLEKVEEVYDEEYAEEPTVDVEEIDELAVETDTPAAEPAVQKSPQNPTQPQPAEAADGSDGALDEFFKSL
jgi:predicted component of type VI protein secretion system